MVATSPNGNLGNRGAKLQGIGLRCGRLAQREHHVGAHNTAAPKRGSSGLYYRPPATPLIECNL